MASSDTPEISKQLGDFSDVFRNYSSERSRAHRFQEMQAFIARSAQLLPPDKLYQTYVCSPSRIYRLNGRRWETDDTAIEIIHASRPFGGHWLFAREDNVVLANNDLQLGVDVHSGIILADRDPTEERELQHRQELLDIIESATPLELNRHDLYHTYSD